MEIEFGGRKIKISRTVILTMVMLAAFVAGIAGNAAYGRRAEIVFEAEGAIRGTTEVASGGTCTPAATQTMPEQEKISVYVTGYVKNPGIVVLEKGQLIADAVNAAGGFSQGADKAGVNLVFKLNENMMLMIPGNAHTTDKAKQTPLPGTAVSDGGTVKTIPDSDPDPKASESSSGRDMGKININTATAAELDKLPGIGASTAEDIILFRKRSGSFKKIEDIMKVPGIKESRFSKIKDLISI